MRKEPLVVSAQHHERTSVAHTDAGPTAASAGWLLTALALWLVAAGRWGSYAGWPAHSLYLTDVVLVVVGLLLARSVMTRRFAAGIAQTKVLWPLIGLVLLAAIRLATDLNYGMIAVRDAAPYLYGLVSVLVLAAHTPRRIRSLLVAVTAFHSTWVTIALVDPSFNDRLPIFGRAQVLELRTDFDATVAGVLAVACILIAPKASSRLAQILVGLLALWSATLVPTMNNRAGLLAFLLAGVWAARHSYVQRVPRGGISRRHRGQVVAAAIGLLIVVTGVVGAYTPAGQRLVGTFDQGSSPETRTTSARLAVYRIVLDYVNESPSRQAVGIGFGPDYLKQTGATPIYDPGGTLKVRAPHNFLLGTYARLGVLGALLQLLVVALGYGLAWRASRLDADDDVARLAALILVAFPVAGAVGVVLESPFGAVPYYWALGVLMLRLDWPSESRLTSASAESA